MRLTLVILLVSMVSMTSFAQVPANSASPAQDRIAFITKAIATTPGKSHLHTELAIALLRRERETSDKALLDQAQAALDESFQLAPENLEAQKVEAALLLARHEFGRALGIAKATNEKVPDDVMTYGYIADAEVAVGDYAAAEKAVQWMLDLRTNNIPGLLRGAEMRQLFGDPEGALQFLNDAYQQTSPDQSEDIAWMLSHMAEIYLAIGKLESADQSLGKALASFPNYYFALELQARVRCAQHRNADAASVLHMRNQHFPQPGSIYAEAEALENAGNAEQAKELFANFEQVARSESTRPDNDNRDLVLYYLNHKHDTPEALRIAHLTISQQHDVWTLDSSAMALYASGNYAEAQEQIDKALAPGIRDGEIFYHAAQIRAARNDPPSAVRYLKSSLEANPESAVSDRAREMLAKFR
jgi:tetratricopeptide (TPR) repeat protein